MRRLANSLVILFGAYLIMAGLLHLVPLALAESDTSPQAAALWKPVAAEGNAAPAPIIPLAPIAQEGLSPPAAQAAGPGGSFAQPERLVIPQINLDAPVVPAIPAFVQVDGQDYRIWDVPAGFQAGWHSDSARLGEPGNLVLNGHHNVHGQVFARLVELELGAEIYVAGGGQAVRYRVTNRLLLPEKDQPLEERLANAHWMLPSQDNRLTLITCWPYETNTHRLIILAEPVEVLE
jgi:LPXTG-site transpeptidase (sortase) family protein